MPVGFPDYYGGLTLPVTVAEGGTGQTSVTSKALLYGAGTSKLIETNVGAANQVLQINSTTLDPTFQDLSIPATDITGVLAVAHGGTGTATPALVAGTGISITGTWPDNTIALNASFSDISGTIAASQIADGTITCAKTDFSTCTLDAPSIITSATSIVIGQTGDTGGETTMEIANRTDFNGAKFTQTHSGYPIDFIFAIGGTHRNLRLQNNTAYTHDGNSVEFQMFYRTTTLQYWFDAGETAARFFVPLKLTTPLEIGQGGTGSTSPALVAGSNISITGSWPNNTIKTLDTITLGTLGTADSGIVKIAGDYASNYTELHQNSSVSVAGVTGNLLAIAMVGLINAANIDQSGNLGLAGTLKMGTPLAVAYGGTGSTSPALVAGNGIALSGSWPNETIALNDTITLGNVTTNGSLYVGDGTNNLQCYWDGSNGEIRTTSGLLYLQNTSSGKVIVAGTDGLTVDNTSNLNDISMSSKITKYNNISTAGVGIPSIVAVADATGQTAAIGATTLYTPPAAGMYRLTIAMQTTTAGSAGTATGQVTVTWNGHTRTLLNIGSLDLTSAGAIGQGSAIIYSDASQPIQYGVAWSGAAGSPVYDLHVRLESI